MYLIYNKKMDKYYKSYNKDFNFQKAGEVLLSQKRMEPEIEMVDNPKEAKMFNTLIMAFRECNLLSHYLPTNGQDAFEFRNVKEVFNNPR